MEQQLKLPVAGDPSYIGFEPSTEKWYFYIVLDDGTPRFLNYVNYFYLGVGPQREITLKEVPKELEGELLEYLQRKFNYVERKLRKNSRSTTITKNYQGENETATEAVSEKHRSKRQVDSKAGSDEVRILEVPERRRATRKSPRDTPPNIPSRGNSGWKPSVNYDELMTQISELENQLAPKRTETQAVSVVKTSDPLPGEAAPKKRRGRPRKIEASNNEANETNRR